MPYFVKYNPFFRIKVEKPLLFSYLSILIFKGQLHYTMFFGRKELDMTRRLKLDYN